MAYAQQGMPGKAIDRLIGPGLAPDTDENFGKIKAKFVDPPASQASSRRPPAPEANKLSDSVVCSSILSFRRGLGAGPSGTRPDFLRQIIREKGEKPGLTTITALCNVLANGLAPGALRPYIGGANAFGLEKDGKAAAAETADAANNLKCKDVRPVCSVDVWRRAVV